MAHALGPTEAGDRVAGVLWEASRPCGLASRTGFVGSSAPQRQRNATSRVLNPSSPPAAAGPRKCVLSPVSCTKYRF
jgi:hypothetical protein